MSEPAVTHSEAPARISARTKGQDGGGAWTTIATGDTAYVREDLADGLAEALELADADLAYIEHTVKGDEGEIITTLRGLIHGRLAHYREATNGDQ